MLDRVSGEGEPEPSVAEDGAAKPERDVLFVRGPSEDGRGVDVVRVKNDELSVGQLREVREGQPLYGDLVKLSQRKEHERLYDVEVLAEGRRAPPPPSRKGPPKVASDAYREGWDAVFGDSKHLPS